MCNEDTLILSDLIPLSVGYLIGPPSTSAENLHLDVELDETNPEVCGTCHNGNGGGIWLWLDVADCSDEGGSSLVTDGVVQCCKQVVGETGFVDG